MKKVEQQEKRSCCGCQFASLGFAYLTCSMYGKQVNALNCCSCYKNREEVKSCPLKDFDLDDFEEEVI